MTAEIALGVSLFGVAVTTLSGIVWGVRQEGRINAHDQRFDLEEKAADDRHAEITQRLQRIERKLDSANGNGNISIKSA